MMGIISSRLLGMLSPDLRYRLISVNSNRRLSLSSAVSVMTERSEPAHTSTGVLHLDTKPAGASLGSAPPTLMTPPSSLVVVSVAEDWMATMCEMISTYLISEEAVL